MSSNLPCTRVVSFAVAIVAVVCGMAMYMWPHRINCLKACHTKPLGFIAEAGKGKDYCALNITSTTINIADFNTKGYTVMHNFLSESDIASLMDIWRKTPELTGGKNGEITIGHSQAENDIFTEIPILEKKILQLKQQIEAETDVFISAKDGDYRNGDFQMTPNFFHTSSNKTGTMRFPWHQDIAWYYQSDDLYNRLSFYVMLEKPSRDEAGVSLVPFDLLKLKAPEFHDLTFRCAHEKGCNFIWEYTNFNKTYIVNADNDKPFVLDFNMTDVACTPNLGPGDLLLFRGDVIHRTQVHNSYRTSLNVILRQGIHTLNLDNQMRGGKTKYEWMARDASHYAKFHPDNAEEFSRRLFVGSLIRNTLWPVRHIIENSMDMFGVGLP